MKKIKEILSNTVIYKSWLSFDGFSLQLLETYTDIKNYRLFSIVLRAYSFTPSALLSIQTYFLDVWVKWNKYDTIRIHFSLEFLWWKKELIWWRKDEEDK
jgi:hypothetical protein